MPNQNPNRPRNLSAFKMVKMRLVLSKHLSIKNLPWRGSSVPLRAKVNRMHCFLCSILLGLQLPPCPKLWSSTQEQAQCKRNRKVVSYSHRWTQPTDFAHTHTRAWPKPAPGYWFPFHEFEFNDRQYLGRPEGWHDSSGTNTHTGVQPAHQQSRCHLLALLTPVADVQELCWAGQRGFHTNCLANFLQITLKAVC